MGKRRKRNISIRYKDDPLRYMREYYKKYIQPKTYKGKRRKRV